MSEKILKSRIIHKHDSEENFQKATGFVPKQAELVVFDPDSSNPNPRIKVGDGVRNINELPFIESSKAEIADKATEADHATSADHATKADTATSADSANYATSAGSATSADSATKDASGNIITDTYATKTELGAVSNLVGDTPVSEQIVEATEGLVSYSAAQELTDEQKVQARANIGAYNYDWHHVPYSESYPDKLYASNINGTSNGINDWDLAMSSLRDNGTSNLHALLNSLYTMSKGTSVIHSNITSKIPACFQAVVSTGALMNNNSLSLIITYDADITFRKAHVCLLNYNSSTDKYILIVDDDFNTNIQFTSDGTIIFNSLVKEIDNTLSQPYRPAESKAVGDALALKADQTELDAVSTLVGDTAVSTQITEAINAIPLGTTITNISDQVVDNSFNFSEADGGLYWVDSNAYVIIANNGAEAGLFLVNKLTNTIAQVFCPISGHMYLVNNGVGSLLFKRLNTKDTYYDLTTTNKTILGAINELDSELTSHTHDDMYYTESEVDDKLEAITSGTTPVKEAEHATTADSATKATQDGNGNVIANTYETKTDAAAKLTEAKAYTDSEIAELINSAPTTLDTLGEIATAMEENADVVEALDAAIGTKANQTDLDAVSALVGDTAVSEQISEAIATAAPTENGQYVVTTAGDGSAYTATVPSVAELKVGASFIMVPHVVSASTIPTLNVNGLGAKEIKRRLSNMATSLQPGYTNTWLAEGKPFRVTYDGTAWVVEGHEKPTSADLYGTLSIDKGGTGASTPLAARENLGVYSKEDHEWTQIYDSGDITESVNAFAHIDITGYRKIMVAIKCVNDGTNPVAKQGSVTFVADNGTQYQFPVWSTMFSSSNETTGNMGWFDIADGWLICSNASRNLSTTNFLSNTEGGTADNLAGIGGGMMKCTNSLSAIMVSALDQDVNYYFNAGSRLIVWGCNA